MMKFQEALQEVVNEFDDIVSVNENYRSIFKVIKFKNFEIEYDAHETQFKVFLKKFIIERTLLKQGKSLNPNIKLCSYGIGRDAVQECYQKIKNYLNLIDQKRRLESDRKYVFQTIENSINNKILTKEEIFEHIKILEVQNVIEK